MGYVLFYSKSHQFHGKASLGIGTNNYNELKSLLLLLKVAMRRGIKDIRIYGESEFVIKRRQGKY